VQDRWRPGGTVSAHQEAGVACRPSKQLDHSSSVRENNVVRLISESRNRKMEADPTGIDESRGKFGLDRDYQKSVQRWTNSMDVGAWRWR